MEHDLYFSPNKLIVYILAFFSLVLNYRNQKFVIHLIVKSIYRHDILVMQIEKIKYNFK